MNSDLRQRIAALPPAKQKLLLRKLEQRQTAAEPAIEPAPERATGGPYPLSFAQERLWFLDQLDPGSPAFNIPTMLRLEGELDSTALERSLAAIVQRHDSLRTTFPERGGQAVQQVAASIEVPLERVDLSALEATERHQELDQLMHREVQFSFDLTRGPLLRTTLVRWEPDNHLLILIKHHIISDGWSFGVLYKELVAVYAALLAGQPSPLTPPRLQYPDFASWQRRWLVDERLQQHLDYWRQNLAEVPNLELPTDAPRPAIQTFRGGNHRRLLDSQLTDRLRALAEAEGASLFMVLLTAFGVVLGRWARQSDFAIGTFIANRTRAELEGLIGFFVNNLALRLDLSGTLTFRQLLARVRRTTLGAFDHQDLPFEKIVEELQPERDMSRPSFFQVMCVLQNTPQATPPADGLTVREEGVDLGRSNFDLSLIALERPDGLMCGLDYNADLFEEATARRLIDHLQRLLAAATAEPDKNIAELDLLPAAERRQLLVDWNDTAVPRPWQGGVRALFERWVEQTPDAPAVAEALNDNGDGDGDWSDRTLSYRQLDAAANRLAWRLLSRGVGPDVRVAVAVEDVAERIIAVLAVIKAGGAFVPLDPDYSSDRLRFMLNDAGPAVVLTTATARQHLGELPCPVMLLEPGDDLSGNSAADPEGNPEGSPKARDDSPPPTQIEPEHLAYLVYTSGSTGRPKGVMVPHGSLANAYLAWEESYQLLTQARCHLQMASFSFDVFVGDLVRALCSGACLALCPRDLLLDPPRLDELMRRRAVDAAEFVPAVVRGLLDHLSSKERDLSQMRLMVVGSDIWYHRELEQVAALCGAETRLISSYGVSEATIDSSRYERFEATPEHHLERQVSIGRPFANNRMYVVEDSRFQPLPVGVPGELMLAGAGLARGYRGRPALTAERFVPNPFSDQPGARLYRTGDLARYLADGQLDFLGRADDQVKVRGFRIEPGEVEAALEELPGVAQAVVVARTVSGVPDKRLVAYLTAPNPQEADADADADAHLDASRPLDTGELRRQLSDSLPDYMVPSAMVVLDSLPLTANGKVNRRALPEPDASSFVISGTFSPPATPQEQRMAALFGEVLRLDKVGRDDSFFDLGGHSLLATQLMSRLRRAFDVDLPLRHLFEAPTVAELCRRVDAWAAQQRGAAMPAIEAGQRGPEDALPLSFAQQRLWFLDRFEPESPFYNIPFAVRLEGPLDRQRLRHALAALVSRHESLRTTFLAEDGEPRQVIAEAATAAQRVELPVIELGHLNPDQRDQETDELARSEARRGFSLTEGPLLRMMLIAHDEQHHVALLTMHHIISDAWSVGVLFSELAACYTGATELPPLPIQYADFAAWQRRWLAGAELEQQADWWRQQLAGAPQILETPTDRPRPASQSFRGDRVLRRLPATTLQPLRRLAEQEGGTLYMVVLAAFQGLLGRWTGAEDLLLGSPIANRNHEEIEGLIGFFVNTLVLRGDLSGDPSFRQLLQRTRETCLGAFAHQDLPFERLVQELAPERDLGRSPLFQVMFVFQNAPAPTTAGGDLRLTPLEADDGVAKFDLALELNETRDGGLETRFEFATDLFDRITIERLSARFECLLQNAASQPDQRLSAVPWQTDEELATLRRWSLADGQDHRPAIEPAGPTSLHGRFLAAAELWPDAPAVRDGERSLSYRELAHQARLLATELHDAGDAGLKAEAFVGLCLPRSADMVLSQLAVLIAGGAWLPLDPSYPEERLLFMIEDAAAQILITNTEIAAHQPGLVAAAHVLCLDAPTRAKASVPFAVDSDRDDARRLAYLIYTSGSTGRPKGVACHHGGVLELLLEFDQRQPVAPGAVYSWWGSPSFDVSVYEVFTTLLAGGTLLPTPEAIRLDGESLAAWLDDEQIAVAMVPPFALPALLHHAEKHPERLTLRRLLVGIEPIPQPLLTALAQAMPDLCVINGYGPTESAIAATLINVSADATDVGRTPIGRPVLGTRLFVTDRSLQLAGIDSQGELTIAGAGLARGYLGHAAKTAESFVPDPFSNVPGGRLYHTGDRVRWRSDGELMFLGRFDHQVKVRGLRIELGEIEARMLELEVVSEAVVLVREDLPGGPGLAAWWCPEQLAAVGSGTDSSPGTHELRQHLATHLPAAMVPSVIERLDAIPLTANDKTDRAALLSRPLADALTTAQSDHRTATASEEMIAGLWYQILELDEAKTRLHPDDDFFALGGHSLLATKMLARLHTAFGVELSVRQLFEQPTIAGLAEAIEQARRSGAPAIPALTAEPARGPRSPLSFAQQRLWLLDRLEPGNPAYNMPMPVMLEGPLDTADLAAALNALVRRHEVLRTVFALDHGEPVQVVQPAQDTSLDLPLIDLSTLAEAERDQEARRRLALDARQPFDLAKGPLLRCTLLRLAEDQHVVLLTLHHIISDGWSMEILVREWVALFSAIRQGEPAKLAPIEVQYADFAKWQRSWLEGPVLTAHTDAWKRRLAGLEPLQLATDRPRPAVQSSRGAVYSTAIPAPLAADLRALGRRHGATLFMVLLALLATLLRRLSGQRDLAIGTPVSGRGRPEVDGLIGFFVNTLVLRADLTAEPDFETLLSQLRQVCLEAWDHQDMPFELLVDELEPERSLARSPLFQVMLAMQTDMSEEPALEHEGLRVRALPVGGTTAKFDLTLLVGEGRSGRSDEPLQLAFEYATDLFDQPTIVRLAQGFVQLASAVVDEPQRPVSSLPLLTRGQQQHLLKEWNDTAQPPIAGVAARLDHRFELQAERHPQVAAVVDGVLQLSYQQLDARANQLAHRLRQLGVGASGETVVGLCLPRSLDLAVALFAVLKADGAWLPLDPNYPTERLTYMLENAQAPVLISRSDLSVDLQHAVDHVLHIDVDDFIVEGMDQDAAALMPPSRSSDPDRLAYVIYTSGSTGRPKGVAVAHRNLMELMSHFAERWPVAAGDRCALWSSPSFDVSVFEMFTAWLAGGSLEIVPEDLRPDGVRFVRWLIDRQIQAAYIPPFHIGALAEAVAKAPSEFALRQFSVAVEPLPEALMCSLRQNLPELAVINAYGPTEATVYATTHDVPAQVKGERTPIGRPIRNGRIYLTDEYLRPVPSGVPGELVIAGAGVARGYIGRPAMTAERFVPDPFADQPGGRLYRTGDRVFHRAAGEIEFIGRFDHQVKLRGYRVEPGEIAAVLVQHPAIREAIVLVRRLASQDGSAGQVLVAYVVPSEAAQDSEAVPPNELRAFAGQHLPDYMVPAAVDWLEALPLTPGGKIDRASLEGRRLDFDAGEAEAIAPRNAVEEVLAGMWAEILDLDELSVVADFFTLGGNSLLATQLLSWVEDSFEVEIPLRRVFEQPTVAGLAEALLADANERPRIEKTAELLLEMAEEDEAEETDPTADEPGSAP